MRILDKTISKAPWAQLTDDQRDRLTAAGNIPQRMFQQTVILTVVDETGKVQQLDGTVRPVGEIEPVAEIVKPTLAERVRSVFTRGEGDE